MFGGPWTQQKLEILSKYLRAYRLIFDRNPKARFFETSYVDAFAGTGEIPRPTLQGFFKDDPDLLKAEEEFRKGSVKRAGGRPSFSSLRFHREGLREVQ